MADIRKEQERDELHRAIWAIADELRGAVDGWDFKNYVLGTMFYRYISENLCNYINAGEIEAGNADFDYRWEGRYSPVWPDGKKHSRNVYAKTREECETLLPGLIQQMKAEIRAIKESGNLDAIPDGISEKKKAIAAYMRKYPEVTSKSAIAKAVQVDKNTVNRYYEEIRREMD